MMRSYRALRRIGRSLFPLVLFSPSLLLAQPFSLQDPYYKLPPAAVGHDGSYIVASDHKVLHRVDASSSSEPVLGALVPLPDGVDGIWCLAAPAPTAEPSTIVGLASHNVGGVDRYCVVKSTDFGSSWELKTPDALADPGFPVTADYWRASLRGMHWLDDGLTGWIWGRSGLVRTTDGGENWEIVYRSPVDGDVDLWNDDRIHAIGFRDANNGMAALGIYHAQKLYQTTDGGRTWNYVFLSFGQNKVVQISWAGNEWRVLSGDPFKPLDQAPNTAIHFSETGQQWTLRSPPINTHQTEMSRICWDGSKGGVMVLRSGEIWKTADGGRKWEQVRAMDPAYPIEFAYYPGTKGFGSSTIFDVEGNTVTIFEASTVTPSGAIYRLHQWGVQAIASASPISSSLAAGLKLKVYPNPATITAEVVFQLKRPARIRLSVIDARGDEAQQIDAGLMGAGEQRLMLDLQGVPSGSYRYILDVDDERAGGELIVTR